MPWHVSRVSHVYESYLMCESGLLYATGMSNYWAIWGGYDEYAH